MDYTKDILTEELIQDIYLDLINEYGMGLSEQERNVARELFLKLNNCGRSWEWIYWAVWQLGDRTISGNKGLFFYEDYCRQIDGIVEMARAYHFKRNFCPLDVLTWMYEILSSFIQIGCITQADYEEMTSICDAYYGDGLISKEDGKLYDFIMYLIKCALRVPKKESEMEFPNIPVFHQEFEGKKIEIEPNPFLWKHNEVYKCHRS